MAGNYNQEKIEDKLSTLMALIEDNALVLDKIDIDKVNRTVEKTERLVIKIKGLKPSEEQLNHFQQTINLLKEILEIQIAMINLAIKKIDPTPAGLASKMSNNLYNIKQKFDSDDSTILWKILKALSKPLSNVLDIFESITPDKWRIASKWERVKLITGMTLTLLGVACIIAVVVLSVANPGGAALAATLVGGIGFTVSVGGIALGAAAFFSCAFGGIFLDITSKTLSKRINKKDELIKLKEKCDYCIEKLDERKSFDLSQSNSEPEEKILKSKNTMFLRQESQARTPITEKLKDVQSAVTSLKSKLNPGKSKTE